MGGCLCILVTNNAGEVMEHLHTEEKFDRLTPEDLLNFVVNLVRGILRLKNEKHVFHGDLHDENILIRLVDNRLLPTLIDLGNAVWIKKQTPENIQKLESDYE